MDLVEVFFRDFVDRRFGSCIMAVKGNGPFLLTSEELAMMKKFRMMDTLTCVQCGAKSYQPSVGKGSRSFNVQCDPECEGSVQEVNSGVPKADESSRKPK